MQNDMMGTNFDWNFAMVLSVVGDASLRGGTEAVARDVCGMLRASGFDSRLLSVAPCSPDAAMPLGDNGRYARAVSNPLDKLCGGAISDCRLRRSLGRIAAEHHADVVINNTYDLAAAMPVGARAVNVMHWSIDGYERSVMRQAMGWANPAKRLLSQIGRRIHYARLHRALKRCDRVVALSQSGKQELLRLIPGIGESKIAVIPNSLPYDAPSQALSPLNNRRVAFVGRLSHEKGVMRLLRIWQKMSARLPGYELRIYGEGPARREMEDYIAQAGLDSVSMMGYCADKPGMYLGSDMLLMTSDSEGFGLVLAEAMHYGVPCASFDCPVSPAEIIGDAGIVAPCYDEDEYARLAAELLSSPGRMAMLQQRCVMRASEYLRPKIMEKWENLIRDITSA